MRKREPSATSPSPSLPASPPRCRDVESWGRKVWLRRKSSSAMDVARSCARLRRVSLTCAPPLARVSPCCCASRARRPSSSRPGEWAWGKEGEGEAPLPLRTKSSIELFGAIFLDRSLMRGSNEYSDCASASAALRRRSARSYSCAAAGSGRRGSEALGKQQIAWAWPTRGC